MERIGKTAYKVRCNNNRTRRSKKPKELKLLGSSQIRIQDEGGSYQTYSVKGYKRVNAIGKVTLPNEVTVSSHIKYFQCKLNLFGKEKIIGLSYNFYQQEWYVDF